VFGSNGWKEKDVITLFINDKYRYRREGGICMGRISMQSTVCAAKNQVSCDLAGEAVILSLDQGIYFTMNPVGARIWSMLKTSIPVHEIRDSIMSEFEIGEETCEADLLAVLEDLAREGLIKVED